MADGAFIVLALATGQSYLWVTGTVLLFLLALTAWFARPVFHTVATKKLEIDDAGVRWRIGDRLQWDLAWGDIASARSIDQYVPDDMPIRGFGLKSKGGKEHLIGDLPDLGPTGKLEEAFEAISNEAVRRGIPVEDEAGWAGAMVLADRLKKGEMSPHPEVEGRWLRPGLDVISIVQMLFVIVVLIVVYLPCTVFIKTESSLLLFNVAFLAASSLFMGLLAHNARRRKFSGILFDEKRVVLRLGAFKRHELPLGWADIENVKAGPSGGPATIRLCSGKVYRAFLSKEVVKALQARFAAVSLKRLEWSLGPVPRDRAYAAREKGSRHNI